MFSPLILDKNDSIFFCDTTNASGKSKRNTVCGDLLSEATSLHKDSFSVSSVPNNLNIFSTQCSTSSDDFDDSWTGSTNSKHPKNNRWQESPLNTITTKTTAATSIANCNFDLAQAFGDYHQHHQHPNHSHSHNTISPASSSSQQQTFQQQKIINSSYSNLTILDYSGSTERIRNQLRAMAESQKRNSTSSNRSSTGSTGSTEFSKCNFLLDEISAHFDKSLSILNDKSSFDNDDDDETDHIAPPPPSIKQLQKKSAPPLPPQPPPRRQQYAKKPLITKVERDAKASSELIERPSHTFDRDPTNLKTCYAESLERCNIDFESSNSINSPLQTHEKFQPVKHSTPNKREMVASTPNLIEHRSNADAVVSSEECLHSSSAYNSLNPLPTNAAETQQQQQHTKGILSAGSRNSLGKGVSFYPFVSQISWHEQSSAEETGERSDSEIR